MKKKEIFEKIISIVSEQTDISTEMILSCNRTEDVLDARSLVVYYCIKHGLGNRFIQEQFKRKGHSFPNRMYDICIEQQQHNRYFANIMYAVVKQLESELSITSFER